MFILVTDRNGVCFSLNKERIVKVVDTKSGTMIVLTDGSIIHTKENFLELSSRLNSI
jgi:hypothetical protein